MKKTSFIFAAFVFSFFIFTSTAFAQITLHTSDYSTITGTTDSIKYADPSTIPVQTRGAAQLWDLSGVTYLPGWDNQYHAIVPAGPFTSAQYADTSSDTFCYYFGYSATKMNAVTANGIVTYGEHINQQLTYVQGSTYYVDTLTLPTQDLIYSSPFTNLPLPCAYPGTFISTLQSNIHFTVTYVGMSWVNQPGEIHRHYNIWDTVTGYGQMKVKYADGTISGYINVLQLKYYIWEVDSSYVNGVALSQIQRDELGFVSMPDPLIGYMYFPIGEVTPLADISYNDINFSTVRSAKVHTRATIPSSVPVLTNTSAIQVYPNPVNESLTIDIPMPTLNGDNSFSIVNTLGQEVCSGIIKTNKVLVNTAAFSKGIYFLQIVLADGNKQVRKIIKD